LARKSACDYISISTPGKAAVAYIPPRGPPNSSPSLKKNTNKRIPITIPQVNSGISRYVKMNFDFPILLGNGWRIERLGFFTAAGCRVDLWAVGGARES
jgi:hypothetical protein